MLIGWFAIPVTFLIALSLPLSRNRLPDRLKVFDIPNARSSHDRPIFRLGGLAALVALSVGSVLAAAGGFVVAGACIAAGVVAGILGLVDDVLGVRVSVRLAVQLVVGAVAAVALALLVDASLWAIPVIAVGFAAYVNMVNFMDGINAISAFHALVAGASFAMLGWFSGQAWLTIAGSMIALAFVAFVPWNLLGARMFLGDVGSYLLGGSIAAVAAATILSGVFWLGVIGPLAIYILETSWAVMRRIAARQPWWKAHRMHMYQRLVDHGYGHIAVACMVAGFSGLTAAAGAFSVLHLPWGLTIAIAGIVLAAAAYFGVSLAMLKAPVRVAP